MEDGRAGRGPRGHHAAPFLAHRSSPVGPAALAHSGRAPPARSGDVAYPAGAAVVIWSPKLNRQLGVLCLSTGTAPPRAIVCLEYSTVPPGRYLAAGESGPGGGVLIWDLSVCQCIGALRGAHRASVVALAFSPCGKHLLSVGAEREASLRLWDWREGTALASAAAPGPTTAVAFSDEGSYFSTAGPSGAVRLWHVRPAAKGGLLQMDLRPPPAGAPAGEKGYAGVAARAGATVCLSASGRLSLLRPGRGFERWTDALGGAASGPTALAASPLHLAAGGARGVVRFFDPGTLAFTGALPRPAARGRTDVSDADEARRLAADAAGPFPDVVALRFDAAGTRLAVCYSDRSLYVWFTSTREGGIGLINSVLSPGVGPIWGLLPLPQGPATPGCVVALASADGSVQLRQLDRLAPSGSVYDRTLIQSFDGLERGARCLAASPDGAMLAAGDGAGNVSVFSIETGAKVASAAAHDDEVLHLAWGLNGRVLASGGRDALVHLFDAAAGFKLRETVSADAGAVTGLCFGEGGLLLSTGASGLLTGSVLGKTGAAPAHSCLVPKAVYGLAVGGGLAVTVGAEPAARLWEPQSGRDLGVNKFEGGAGEAVAVAVTDGPSGVYACSHVDHRVRLYSASSGDLIGTATGHSEVATAVAFSSDGTRLISAGGDGVAFVWRVPAFAATPHPAVQATPTPTPTPPTPQQAEAANVVPPASAHAAASSSTAASPTAQCAAAVAVLPTATQPTAAPSEAPAADLARSLSGGSAGPSPAASSNGGSLNFDVGSLPSWHPARKAAVEAGQKARAGDGQGVKEADAKAPAAGGRWGERAAAGPLLPALSASDVESPYAHGSVGTMDVDGDGDAEGESMWTPIGRLRASGESDEDEVTYCCAGAHSVIGVDAVDLSFQVTVVDGGDGDEDWPLEEDAAPAGAGGDDDDDAASTASTASEYGPEHRSGLLAAHFAALASPCKDPRSSGGGDSLRQSISATYRAGAGPAVSSMLAPVKAEAVAALPLKELAAAATAAKLMGAAGAAAVRTGPDDATDPRSTAAAAPVAVSAKFAAPVTTGPPSGAEAQKQQSAPGPTAPAAEAAGAASTQAVTAQPSVLPPIVKQAPAPVALQQALHSDAKAPAAAAAPPSIPTVQPLAPKLAVQTAAAAESATGVLRPADTPPSVTPASAQEAGAAAKATTETSTASANAATGATLLQPAASAAGPLQFLRAPPPQGPPPQKAPAVVKDAVRSPPAGSATPTTAAAAPVQTPTPKDAAYLPSRTPAPAAQPQPPQQPTAEVSLQKPPPPSTSAPCEEVEPAAQKLEDASAAIIGILHAARARGDAPAAFAAAAAAKEVARKLLQAAAEGAAAPTGALSADNIPPASQQLLPPEVLAILEAALDRHAAALGARLEAAVIYSSRAVLSPPAQQMNS